MIHICRCGGAIHLEGGNRYTWKLLLWCMYKLLKIINHMNGSTQRCSDFLLK